MTAIDDAFSAAVAAAIAAQMAGATVAAAPLVAFDFASGMVRVWAGAGPFIDLDGQTWQGLGEMAARTASASGRGLGVEEVTYSLSATSGRLANFVADAEETIGRTVRDYLQFFDVRKTDTTGAWVDFAPLGSPWQYWYGTMGPLDYVREAVRVGETPLVTLSVTAHNGLVNRRRPPNGQYTHGDQQARHPGDNIFLGMPKTGDKIVWPKFS